MNFNGLINHGDFSKISEVMLRAHNGEKLNIVFLGGSITQGCLASIPSFCYAYKVYKWWCNRFPKANFSFFNAGIGGTTSQFGVARVEEHVLSKKPDFLLVEFAVNDSDTPFFEETYEGLIRRILGSEESPALLLMNNATFDKGENAERIHLEVAKYYNLPMVSMKSTLFKAVKDGELSPSSLSTDFLHPNDFGHDLVAKVIIDTLEQIFDSVFRYNYEKETDSNQNVSISSMAEYKLPKPLTLNRYENSFRIKSKNMDDFGIVFNGFCVDRHPKKDFLDIFSGGFIGEKVNDSISFDVECTGVSIQYKKAVNKPAPIASVVIDGNEEKKVVLDANFDEDWGDCLYIQTIDDNLEKKVHNIIITIEEAHEDDKSLFYVVSVIANK